jgi:hypothetical protein
VPGDYVVRELVAEQLGYMSAQPGAVSRRVLRTIVGSSLRAGSGARPTIGRSAINVLCEPRCRGFAQPRREQFGLLFATGWICAVQRVAGDSWISLWAVR